MKARPKAAGQLEQNAKTIEKLLQSMIAMPLHAFYLFDHRTRQIMFGEEELAALYGYTVAEIHALPHGLLDLVHPEDQPGHELLISELLKCEDDRITAMKLRMRHKDGHWEWIACNHRPYERDANGQVVSEIGVVQIITQAVEKTAALQESQARYRTIFEQAADAIWILNASLVIEEANPKMCEMLGYSHEELVGMTLLDTIPPERHERAKRIIQTTAISGGGTYKGIHRRKDGSLLPVEFSMNHLRDGRFMTVERDITERLQREETSRQRDMFYRSLFHNNTSGVARFDASTRLLEVNPKLREMLGEEYASLAARTLHDLIAPRSRKAFDRLINAMIKGEAYPSSLRLEIRCAQGRVLSVHAAPSAFYHSHPESGKKEFHEGIIILSDITDQEQAEAALRESEARYARVMRGISDGLWDWNIKTQENYISPQWKALLGYADSDLSNHINTFIALLHPDDVPRVNAAVQAHVEKRVPYDIEFRLRTKAGDYRWFRSRGEAERDHRGRPTRMAGTITDITERWLAEEALRQSEERYRLLADNTDDIVTLINLNGEQLYLSTSYYRKTRWTAEELAHTDWHSRVHPADLAKVEAAIAASAKGEVSRIEHRTLCRDGTWIWLESCGKPIRDSNGQVERLLIWSHDVTERKKAEESYRRQFEFNRALVNHTSALIVVMDGRGRIRHINQAVERRFGYLLEEVMGLDAWTVGIMDAKETLRSRERFKKLLSGKDNPPSEVRMRTKSGEWRIIELSSTTTRKADGSVDRVIVTGTDVTDRNLLQQEVLKISEQEQARIGHDLHDGVGQTMTGIISLIDALESSLTGAVQRDARRIRELVQEAVLEVRRMSHGLSPAAVKNRGIGGALQLLAETVRTNYRTDCLCTIEEGISLSDEETQTHLFRIAQEAINNALRHGHPKQVSLSLRRLDSQECALQIEDNGKGLKKSKAPSQGIGMRVMNYRAHLIGGDLQIEPLSQGVRVTCTFPCPDLSDQAKPGQASR